MANKSPSINLFKGREKSFLEKFINWSLTLGRVVVITTEGIALLAFLYRFSLDRQLVDLHDKIKQKETIVKLLQKDEEKYRNLQERIELISKLEKEENAFSKTSMDIIKLIPSNSINALTISVKNIKIEAHFQSLNSLTSFINSIRKYPNIKSVSLDKIENKTSSSTINVGITALFKTEF